MKLNKALRAGVAAIALSAGYATVSAPVLAQQTTSSIRGVVTDAAGGPLSGATVVVRDDATGFERTVTTNNAGGFSIRNLSVSGNYTIVVDDEGYQGEQVDNIQLSLGDTTQLNFSLDPSTSDTVVVVGTRSVIGGVALGPNSTFDLKTLETAPAINRNLADIVRIDPRVFVDESRGDINSISCNGKNPRFNSLTVDGVRLNDSFGLNSNGFPTERMPFSFDAIEQVSVELAPFAVEYGGFTACNINAVTKSGTNEIHGSAFFDYTSDGLRGDTLEGQAVDIGDFDEKRYGASIGLPIIKDNLFLFAAYEKLDGANIIDRGVIEQGFITQAQIDQIANIANTLYSYDPGGIPTSFDNEDEKLLVKLDWNISDNHRANVIYNYNDGFNITRSDGDVDEFEFSNHLYERGAELNSWVGSVYSDWTDNFSTELRVGYLELKNRQNCLDGGDFGEFRVSVGGTNVYLGCDDSRHSNRLNYDLFNIKAKANYSVGDHNLTFGFERETLDIFNLFVQHTETETRFGSIAEFGAGIADQVEFNNAPSLNPEDAAAEWGYSLNTLYAQDEFSFGDRLNVVAGLRYDFYTSSDVPPENPDFLADYGFSNATNLDGAGLLQPRFAFTYDASDSLTIRGGAGLFSGGNPNVWLSNNFSSNNVTQFGARLRGTIDLFDPADTGGYTLAEDGVPNGPGYAVPVLLADDVALGAAGSARNFEINYLDPDFDIPADWKFSIGATYVADFGDGVLGGDYIFNADVLVSRGQDSAIVLRADLDETGRTPEGRPIFASNREGAFVLTNADEGNRSLTVSGSVQKDYDNGIDWSLGYAYNDSKDTNPMTSSVAFSNYTNRAFFDPQEQVLSRSNYNIRHRFTGTANFERDFWKDNYTRLSIFGSLNSGQPYSLAETDAGFFGFTPFIDDDDANILITDGTRNSENGSWWGKVDIKVEQEIPGVFGGHKAKVFMVIDNFTNLLNDEWGVLRQVAFPNTFDPTPDLSDPNAVTEPEQRRTDASLYEIRFGVKYEF